LGAKKRKERNDNSYGKGRMATNAERAFCRIELIAMAMKRIGNRREGNQQKAHQRQDLECLGSSAAFGNNLQCFTS
jgi:hypothetical protein